MAISHHVAVVGAGPAGCAVAAELATRGVDLVWIAPDFDTPWPNNYGVWCDEVDGLPLLAEVALYTHRWDSPRVYWDAAGRSLTRAYGRVDGEALKHALVSRADVERIEGRVSGAVHGADGTVLTLEDGREVACRLVIDASGHKPSLVTRRGSNPGFQTAWGVVATIDGADPLDGHDMVLMDFRPVDDADTFETPTFLYAMRLDETRYFFEETVLVARPPVPIAELRARLERRLAARGARISEVFDEERCVIPMGHRLPERGRVVGFGGAASQVHPATGYMLSRVLRDAGALAETIAESLDRSPDELSEACWNAVWPVERMAARRFYAFGMETLLTLDPTATRRFFEAFFMAEDDAWRGYLSDTLSGREVAAVMLDVFANADMGLRSHLMLAGIGRQTPALAAALWGALRR